MNKILILLVVVFAAGLTGCDLLGDIIADKVSEKVAEEVTEEVIESALEEEGGGKADVDLSSGKVNIKTDKGSFSGGTEAKVPDSFPKDIPLPDNAKVRMAIDNDSGVNVTLESENTPDKLAEFAKSSLEKEGWTQKSTADMGQMKMMGYEKEGRKLNVNIVQQKDQKQTTVMYAMQKPQK